jgi:hypothetical protein
MLKAQIVHAGLQFREFGIGPDGNNRVHVECGPNRSGGGIGQQQTRNAPPTNAIWSSSGLTLAAAATR